MWGNCVGMGWRRGSPDDRLTTFQIHLGTLLCREVWPTNALWDPPTGRRSPQSHPPLAFRWGSSPDELKAHWEEKSLIPFLSLSLHLHKMNTWAQVKFLAERGRTFSEKKHNTVPANLELELKQRKMETKRVRPGRGVCARSYWSLSSWMSPRKARGGGLATCSRAYRFLYKWRKWDIFITCN